jgi:hypothetical protein
MTKPSPFKLTKASVQVTHHQSFTIQQGAALKPAALIALSTHVSIPVMVTDATPVLPVIPEAMTQNYTFFSEGDATVADFDASKGTIETYEGRTFVLGATAAASAPESLQDSGSSVHYRCDQSGSCTLSQAGQIMQNVRMM